MPSTRVFVVVSLILAGLLEGCVGPEAYYVDSRFTVDEEADIRAAAKMWSEATGGALNFDLIFGHRVDILETKRNAIVKVGARAAFNRFPSIASKTAAAFYHEGNSFESSLVVVIADQIEPALLRAAVAHEMGHSFGLQHVPEEHALMHADLHKDVSKCVTEVDLREARRHFAFDADRPCARE